MKRFFAFLITASLLVLTGCPDYSHLRPEPDYKNMSDSAPEGGIGEDAQEGQ